MNKNSLRMEEIIISKLLLEKKIRHASLLTRSTCLILMEDEAYDELESFMVTMHKVAKSILSTKQKKRYEQSFI